MKRRKFLKKTMIGSLCLGMGCNLDPAKTHILTFSFDDGFKKSFYRAAEIHENYGLKACFNVIAKGHFSDFKAIDQWILPELLGDFNDWNHFVSRGHEVMPHTWEHLNLTKIPLDQAKTNIDKYQQRDVFGNSYWGNSQPHWYNTNIQISLLAYEIFKKAEKTKICREIERYLLREKDLLGWRNTFQTAKVLTVILKHNFDKKTQATQKENLIINAGEALVINQFPYEKTFAAGTPIKITKKGKDPIYFSAYQSYWNENPSPQSDLFAVKTQLIQNGQPTDSLVATFAAKLEVTVDITRKADYVLIEIPIPAGCSYGKKVQPRNWSYWRTYPTNYEVHREYFKDKVAIYCRELPIGKYTYTIHLEPRFTGNYTLNPSKVEEMYFPVFYGRNTLSRVFIQ